MILRKPYAFLIRNFKLVHIILLLIMIYVVIKSNNIYGFFSAYSKSSYGFYESTLVNTYANPLFYLGCLVIVLLSSLVMVLMKQKDKPAKLYVWMAFLYTGIIILLYSNSGYLMKINVEEILPRTSRMLSDINLVALLPQLVMIAMVFIRAIGFNIKKFNFSKDLEELQIDVSDDEEFELTIGTDSQKINRILNKNKRELLYFYLENKTLILTLIAVSIVMLFGAVYNQVAIVNKIYNQKEAVRFNDLSYKVDGIYSTNLNYRSENISEGENTFVVLKMSFYNSGKTNKRIKTNYMNLVIEDNYYLPILRKYGEFIDIGYGYDNQIIEPNSRETYIFVYKIDKKDLNKKIILSYTENIYATSSGLGNAYVRFYVNPENIDKISTFPIADLGKEVNYSISNIKDTKLTINKIELNDKFSIKNGNLINIINDPLDNKKVMKINYEYKPDSSVYGINSFLELLHKYGYIKYYKDGKAKTIKYVDLTPKKSKESDLYLSVPTEVADSDKIILYISVRNLVYVHKLK